MRSVVVCLTLIVSFAIAGEPEFTGKLSSLKQTESGLGAEWKPRPGMVIDNVDDLSGIAAESQEVAAMVVGQAKPHGVHACGDFSYNVDGQPQQFVTLRIFVFTTADKASAFYKLKYTSEAAAKSFKKVDLPVGSAVDNVQTTKRNWLIGNVLMTCSELKQEGNHIKLLNAFASAMKLVGEK